MQRGDIFLLSPTCEQAIPRTHFCGRAEFTANAFQVPFALYFTRNMCNWEPLHDGCSSDATTG
jgi:hypothetical protein